MIEKGLTVLGYVFGAVFALLGLVSLIGDPLAAVPLLLISALLLPPSSRWLTAKLGQVLNPKSKGVAVVMLFVVFGAAAEYEDERDGRSAAEEAAEAKARDERTRFYAGKDSIVSLGESLISDENFVEALQVISTYGSVEDEALNALKERAQSGRQRVAAKEREKVLVAQVRTVPAKETKRNMDIYRELIGLDPDNQRYQERFEHYQKIHTREQQQRRQRAVFLGETPVASAWDGTYREVKEYLRAVARDPKSVDVEACTKVFEADEGWVVACDWRARNGFGGMNRESNWFVIRQMRVIEMKPITAYNM